MSNHVRVDPATIPVAVSLARIKCIEQEDSEFILDTEDDEPYILVITVNGQGIQTIGNNTIPRVAARLFRIGPIQDFDKDDIKPAPPNVLWGLNGSPDPIPTMDRVFF